MQQLLRGDAEAGRELVDVGEADALAGLCPSDRQPIDIGARRQIYLTEDPVHPPSTQMRHRKSSPRPLSHFLDSPRRLCGTNAGVLPLVHHFCITSYHARNLGRYIKRLTNMKQK